MGRRDGNDVAWKKVKDVVKKRDGDICRLLRVISIQQALTLKKNATVLIQKLDPAHIFPVSTHPLLCYESDNIVTLNRYSHSMLDSGRDPIKGESITNQETMAWWEKIVGPQQWDRLQKKLLGEEYE